MPLILIHLSHRVAAAIVSYRPFSLPTPSHLHSMRLSPLLLPPSPLVPPRAGENKNRVEADKKNEKKKPMLSSDKNVLKCPDRYKY
jgi:hypothetical protein